MPSSGHPHPSRPPARGEAHRGAAPRHWGGCRRRPGQRVFVCRCWGGSAREVLGAHTPAADLGLQVGLVVAAAKIPETFAPGLSRRSAVDQGLVTGLATGVHYLLAVGTQEALQAGAARGGARSRRSPGGPTSSTGQRALTLSAGPGRRSRSGWRCSGGSPRIRGRRWPGVGCDRPAGGRPRPGSRPSASRRTRVGLRALDDRLGAGGRVAGLPVAVPLGPGDRLRRRPPPRGAG